jgi:hypothetical protein
MEMGFLQFSPLFVAFTEIICDCNYMKAGNQPHLPPENAGGQIEFAPPTLQSAPPTFLACGARLC